MFGIADRGEERVEALFRRFAKSAANGFFKNQIAEISRVRRFVH